MPKNCGTIATSDVEEKSLQNFKISAKHSGSKGSLSLKHWDGSWFAMILVAWDWPHFKELPSTNCLQD
jgi:hypothetical protein